MMSVCSGEGTLGGHDHSVCPFVINFYRRAVTEYNRGWAVTR